MPLILTKHHGLGNDFLVLLDLDDSQPVDEARARALCDRHTGVGADGFIRVTAGADGADLTMHLRNADGSEAEMSGNGIRCLAQAAVDAGVAPWPELRVATGGGVRHLTVHPETARGVRRVAVDMGEPSLEDEGPAAFVDMGNPHVVLRVDDPERADLAAFGRRYPDVNVELVAPTAGGAVLVMRVHERGVGETLACGTGACAAAAAGRHWKLTGDTVVVRQRGGDAEVDLRGTTAVLTGPTTFIARVEVP